jgi:tRNA/rRNA methyltransferase/tRNA (cytidine32/uridine32-2'-O)-methyltransferase
VIRFILHRPRNAQNIGSAARALANTGAGPLWVVEPEQFDRAQAARLAAGADAVLEAMTVVRTLEEALADCTDVVMTTGRLVEGRPPLSPAETAARLVAGGGQALGPEVALVFGDEVRGLGNQELQRAAAVATIPTVEKGSVNLAQSVLLFAYEVMLARGDGRFGAGRAPPGGRPGRAAAPALAEGLEPAKEDLADERLLGLLRDRSQSLLLGAGFLNPQQPDKILDELLRLLRRARPSRREVQLLLSAVEQLARSK